MRGAGPRLFGRELGPTETAITVSVRDGRTVVADGPADDPELVSAINVIECADLDSALESSARPDRDRVAEGPYLLLIRIGPPGSPVTSDRELIAQVEAWRRDLMTQGRYVMGSSFGGIEPVATLTLRDARTRLADSPFNPVESLFVAIDVVQAGDRREAVAIAAAHPLACTHTIEVRPFQTGG